MYKYLFFMFFFCPLSFASLCKGHIVNPITDVCWSCLFPLSIGNTKVVNSSLKDTPNAKTLMGMCPKGLGVNIGYWEPIALVDVTDTPYCLSNLGGVQLPLGSKSRRGGKQVVEQTGAFYHAHWYRYPLITWLNLITSTACRQSESFDIAYLTELDPTWSDSNMNAVIHPESIVLGMPTSQSACAVDSLSSTLQKKPLDELFWCAGSQGSHYPLSGHINAPNSPVQSSLLLAERLNFKLHQEGLLLDTSGDTPCAEKRTPILPKSRYRYEMTNLVPDGKHCYPSGYSTLDWETSKIKPYSVSQFGYLVWRKRNCTFSVV